MLEEEDKESVNESQVEIDFSPAIKKSTIYRDSSLIKQSPIKNTEPAPVLGLHDVADAVNM